MAANVGSMDRSMFSLKEWNELTPDNKRVIILD